MRSFLLGTDWWTDCDDAMAVRVLARAVKAGRVGLKAIGINACMDQSVASLVSFLQYEGIGDVPVGIDTAATDFGGAPPYQARLAARLRVPMTNADAEDAVTLYLRILRESATPVEIIEIGYPQVLNAVLQADKTLFADKVSRVWMMAGKWDELPAKENNFSRNARASTAAHAFCRDCPVPVTFLGFEVGASVLAGGRLKESDVLHQVLVDHGSAGGRSAWDPMLVYAAVAGDPTAVGYRCVTGTATVDPATGENDFIPSPDGKHQYLVKCLPDEEYQRLLDDALQ